MFKRTTTLLIVTGILAAATACTGTPHLSQHWGKSFETARQKQIVDAQAGEKTREPAGLDGQVADGAMSKYYQSFKVPVSPK